MKINAEIYEKNLKALANHRPGLKERVEQTPFPDWISFQRKNGFFSGVFELKRGETCTLFENDDPRERCRSLCEDYALGIGESTFLFGMGMGYFPLEIHRRKPKSHHLFVFEKYFDVFTALIRYIDIRDLISDSFVHLYFDDDDDKTDIQRRISSDCVGHAARWINGHSYIFSQDYYEKLKSEIEYHLNYYSASAEFLKNLGTEVTVNVVENMKDVIFSASAMALKDQFSGYPAVAVGAGPSPSKNIHHLKEIAGKGLIISCDTSLALLTAVGVTPHFLVTLDYRKEGTIDKFEGVPLSQKTALVYNSQVYPGNLKTSLGPHFVLGCSYQTQVWLEEMLDWKESYHAASNVGKMSYDLANHLGCNPIVLIGMDHALAESRAHAPMAWKEDLEDYKELVDIDYLERPDIYGRPVWTTTHLIKDNQGLGYLTKTRDALVINASEGGLPIEGTRVMRFADTIPEYFDRPLPADVSENVSKLHDAWPRPSLGGLVQKFEVFKKKVDFVLHHCSMIVPKVTALQGLLIKEERVLSDGFLEGFTKLCEMTKASKESEWQEATGVIQQAVLDAHYEKRDYLYIKDSQDTAKERVWAELKAAQKIYSRVQEEMEAFAQAWNGLIKWLKEVIAAQALLTRPTDSERAEGVQRLIDLGCHREAYLHLEGASANEPPPDLFDAFGCARPFLESDGSRPQGSKSHRPGHGRKARNQERIARWETMKDRILKEVATEASARGPFSWTHMAEFYFKVKEFGMAKKVVETAAAFEPDNPELLFIGAALQELDGEHLEAIRLLEKVLSLSPTMKKAYNLLALVAHQLEDPEMTEKILAITRPPEPCGPIDAPDAGR